MKKTTHQPKQKHPFHPPGEHLLTPFLIRKHFFLISSISVLIIFYLFLYKLFIPRVNQFGCFDDCFNFMGGYFMLNGKRLYSEIFFNHQMLMAYISMMLQMAAKPENIYDLILIHRKFLLFFSFIMNALILYRFRLTGAGFVLFYESTKFYLFGDRFLAEGFIVYPLVYLCGIVWYKCKQVTLKHIDYIFAALFSWFAIFMREPYIPLTIILFTIIIYGKPFTVSKKISLALFFILCSIILAITPLQDYYDNVVTINRQTILSNEAGKGNLGFLGLLKMFFYPFLLFWGGEWNIFRQILIGLSGISIITASATLMKRTNRKYILALFLLLGIANIRTVTPGHVFYDAFHLLVWYGIFLFFCFSLLHDYFFIHKRFTFMLLGICFFLFAYLIVAPSSYIHEKQYPHETFITNYGRELQAGEAIRKLSLPTDTLFVDGFDDLVYWQAKRLSPYRYSWYTSVMPLIEKYSKERLHMFAKNPPDFYYGSCPKERNAFRLLPETQQKKYIRLNEFGKPGCLFIHKEKIALITKQQWKDAAVLGYELKTTTTNSEKHD